MAILFALLFGLVAGFSICAFFVAAATMHSEDRYGRCMWCKQKVPHQDNK